MDYTIARYKQEAFENLAFQATLKKFLEAGYPEELSQLKYKPHFLKRGLLVDRKRGNILKADTHKYIKHGYHGHKIISKEERRKLYNTSSFRAHTFLSIDTFFELSEVQLFAEIVDFMNENPGKIKKDFEEIYQDLRYFIDLSHQDNSIKDEVIANPEKYIDVDMELANTLIHLIESEKSLFLLTNSNFQYTQCIMSFLLDGKNDDFPKWQDYWDILIVSSNKPSFFTSAEPFYEVEEETKKLKPHKKNFLPHKFYHGGNARLFEKMTGYVGDEILYAGDHIYGDIVRSKETVNWRTLLLVPELEIEIPIQENQKILLTKIKKLIQSKERLEEISQYIQSKININNKFIKKHSLNSSLCKMFSATTDKLKDKLSSTELRLQIINKKIKELTREKEKEIHPIWGSIMNTGLEHSRFAKQVIQHACLYTSKITNLKNYSPFKKFVSFHERMPHEF